MMYVWFSLCVMFVINTEVFMSAVCIEIHVFIGIIKTFLSPMIGYIRNCVYEKKYWVIFNFYSAVYFTVFLLYVYSNFFFSF